METGQNHPHHKYSVGEHTIVALQNAAPKKILRLTMLLHDMAKPICKTTDENGIDHFLGHQPKGGEMAKNILRRLKFDNDTINRVSKLVVCHDSRPEPTEKAVRKAVFKNGMEQYPLLFEVQRADVLAQSEFQREEKLKMIDLYEKEYQNIIVKNQCLSLKELAVKGADLIAIGMQPGKEIGETLQKLLEIVLEEPELNTKEKLIELVHKM